MYGGNAIYMPEDPRYRALREAILGSITDVIDARKRNDFMGQIQGFMDVLTGGNPTGAPSILEAARGNPMAIPGDTPAADASGYIGGVPSILEGMRGNPAVGPSITPEPDFSGWPMPGESRPGDIVDAMAKINDPALFMQMLPTALDYSYKTKAKEDPVVKMEFTRKNKDGSTTKRVFSERLSRQAETIERMAAQGWEAGEIVPPKMSLKENKKTKTYWAVPEDGRGQPTDTGIPYDKDGPETWYQKTIGGVEYNISSRGKKEPVKTGDAAGKDLDRNKKRIELLKEANTADLRPYQKKSTEGFTMEAPEEAYVALQRVAMDPKTKMTPEKRKAVERLKRVNARLEEIKQLAGGSASTGQLIRNPDGTYTYTE